MKYFFITLSVTIIISLTIYFYLKYRLKNTSNTGNLKTSLEVEITKYLKRVNINSLALGVHKNGITYFKGYGDSPPNNTTVFQIGSITKVFTVALLQTLTDEKIIQIDATLDELIGENIALSPAAKRITLHQLATHSSGLPNIPRMHRELVIELVGKKSIHDNPYSLISTDSIFEYLATTEDNHRSGRFVYSNYGMGLLGHVLEILTQKSYETLLVEKVLDPLEMHNTRINLTTETEALLVDGYTSKGKKTPLWTFKSLEGAGALNSNCSDMLQFITAHLENSSPIFKSLSKIEQSRLDDSSGMGWLKTGFLENFFGNQEINWHNGQVGGYSSYISVDRKNSTGVIVMANKSIDLTMLGILLTRLVRIHSWSDQSL